MQRLIEQYPLQRGSHASRDDGMCAMEMVAWLAGEAHSDEPDCTCPVLAAFVRACNDAMSDELRNHILRPLVPQLVHSRATATIEQMRGLLAMDTMVRSLVPTWLQRRQLHAEAEALRRLPTITGRLELMMARRALETCGRGQRAALWVIDRAIDRAEPRHYVAGVVQVGRSLNDRPTWVVLGELASRMAAARTREPGRAPGAKSVLLSMHPD